jgi:hypothetical protein
LVFTKKKREKNFLTKEEIAQVKNIVITAPFEDHLHFKTLKEFPTVEIWCSSQIRSILLKKKLPNKLNELSKSSNFIGALEVKVYPAGFPYNTTAYCLHISNDEGFSVFHEGHVVNKKIIKIMILKQMLLFLLVKRLSFLDYLL